MSDLPEGDTRTVLYALPEDQPDSLGEGTKSNPANAEPIPPGPDGGVVTADGIVDATEEAPKPKARRKSKK